MLSRWDVLRVYRSDLSIPHDKYCICVCPIDKLFLYINSEPPLFRKKREVVVQVARFELTFLRKDSFIDSSTIVDDLPPDSLAEAIADINRSCGSLPPFLVQRIKAAVASHGALMPIHSNKVLE